MLLVLRLFAVYAATAGLAILLASRFVRPIRPRTALLLGVAPLLLVGRAFVTAGVYAPLDIAYQALPLSAYREQAGIGPPRTPVLVDVVASYIPWRKAVREAIENGRLPLWNRFVLAGEPLLAVQEPAALHPFTWIGLLLPLAQSWTLDMALRLLLALLCGYLFFAELTGCELPALLGAFAWALSDFLVFYLGYPLTPAAATLPLLMLGLSRLVRDPGLGAVALTVVALLLVAIAGHPETLLHVVAAGGIWFLFELARAERGRRVRAVFLSVLAGALALGLAAIVLLPFLEILPHTREHEVRSLVFARSERSVPLSTGARLVVQNAMPYAFGSSGRGSVAPGFEVPAAYAGALLFPLALAGLFSLRRDKWAFLALAITGVAMHARLPVVSEAVGSLPLFRIALNDRMVFLATSGIVGLAVLGAWELERGAGHRAVLFGCGGATLLLALLFVQRLPTLDELGMPRAYSFERIATQVAPLLLAAGVVFLSRKPPSALLATLLVLFAGSRAVETGGIYSTNPARAFYPRLPILDSVPRNAPWRTAPIGYVFPPNMPTLYEVEDVRGYVSLTLAPLAETFPVWCVPRPVEWNRVADPTKPFISFLNVRWILAPSAYVPPNGWRLLGEGPEGKLLENPHPLSRAFAPRSILYETDAPREIELLAKIRDFAAQGIVGSAPPPGTSVEAWLSNGPAEVRVARYLPERLTLEIDAKADAIVGTSIPRWPGWKLSVDGEPRPLLVYNRAFLGFGVAPGRHAATLRYLPDGLVRGAAVSGATLLLAIALLAVPRRRKLG